MVVVHSMALILLWTWQVHHSFRILRSKISWTHQREWYLRSNRNVWKPLTKDLSVLKVHNEVIGLVQLIHRLQTPKTKITRKKTSLWKMMSLKRSHSLTLISTKEGNSLNSLKEGRKTKRSSNLNLYLRNSKAKPSSHHHLNLITKILKKMN